MTIVFKEITLLVTPILSVRPIIVEVSSPLLQSTETPSYTWNAYISRDHATATRFEFFASKIIGSPMTNWGFVSINDSRKVATLEIGLDKDEFENLKYGLGAYGPQNCVLQAEVTFSDFVDDVMGGRGAVLACPPELTFKGCY